MNITEARSRCNELRKQINSIQKEYDFEGYTRFIGKEKSKPLEDELERLVLAIIKAEDDIEIEQWLEEKLQK